uniref:Uncharacterized protein n=1 Tax=Onchocerca volvulus TaxID=6282 RepID=A0A8R1TL61_ONCVO
MNQQLLKEELNKKILMLSEFYNRSAYPVIQSTF